MVWIESQCAAVPTDPNDDLLIEWKKIQSPFLPLPPKEMDLTGWRDPFAFSLNTICTLSNSNSIGNSTNDIGAARDGEVAEGETCKKEDKNNSPEFRILMGSGIKGKGGTALVYRSKDLMEGWELEGTLCEGTIEDSGVVWECPLLIPLLPVPPQQRSKHPHIPPGWLHQPSKYSSKTTRTSHPLVDPSPGSLRKEEGEKAGAAGVALLGGTASHGGRPGPIGVYTPPSTSSPAPSGSTQALLSPFQKDPSAGNSIEGSPLVTTTGAAASKPIPVIPKAITTAVQDLLDISKQGKEDGKQHKQEQEVHRADAEVETENEFEFIPSGGASPGNGSDGGSRVISATGKDEESASIDRQGSIEMWPPSSAEAVSPVQKPVAEPLESYQSFVGGTDSPANFPVDELAAKLERAVTLEHWNAQEIDPAGDGTGNGSLGGNKNNGAVAIGGRSGSGNGFAGNSRQSSRPNSRLSSALDGVPEVKEPVASIGPGFGSRLGDYDDNDEDEDAVEEAAVGCSIPPPATAAAAAATAAAAAAAAAASVTVTSAHPSRSPSSSRLMPPPSLSPSYSGVSSADDISEDRFAMAFSRVPALQLKKHSAASLGLLERTATESADGGAAVEKKRGYPIPAAASAQSLSSYSTDMTPMHPQSTQQAHSLSTLAQHHQQQGGIGSSNTEQRQWHFFTISPDAPTNPVLYWTGFMSQDLFSSDNKGEVTQNEEDAGPAAASEGIHVASNKGNNSNQHSENKPPPQFEIEDAKGPYRLDLGDILYAPNVCQDGQGRWILWGWLQERRKMGTYSYAGCLSLPRVLHATDEGRLVQAPAPEVVALRKGREFHAQQVNLYPESVLPIQRVSGDRLDIECTIERGSALAAGLLFRSHEAEAEGSTAIVYDWDRNHLEAIFNVPPNWQPHVLPQQSYPNSATTAGAASKGDDKFSFNEEDLIGLGDAVHFDPAAYLCTPRYSVSRTPSMNVFSPDATMASSPHAPIVGAAGVFSDNSPPVSTSSPVESDDSVFSTGVNSEIGGMVHQPLGSVPKLGSSLQHAFLRSSSHANLATAGGGGGAGGGGAGGGGAGEREIKNSLPKSSSYSLLGSSIPRVGSFIQRPSPFLAPGSPRSQAIIDASEAADMDTELSTLLEDLAAPMRGNVGEDAAAAPPQMPEPRRVGGPLLMRPADKLHLRIFVDHSCVEVFTGTGEVLSTRIYRGQQPQSSNFFDGTGEVDAGIEFIAFGGAAIIEKISAYEVASAWKDHGAETASTSRWGTPTANQSAQAAGSRTADAAGATTPGSSMAGGNVGKSAAERADELFDEMLMGF